MHPTQAVVTNRCTDDHLITRVKVVRASADRDTVPPELAVLGADRLRPGIEPVQLLIDGWQITSDCLPTARSA